MELARALRSRLDDDVIIEKLFCSRETIQKAKQDDFKVIWDRTIVCVGILHKASFPLWRFTLYVPKSNDWEQDWERLNQIWGLSQNQFFAELLEQDERRTQEEDLLNRWAEEDSDEEGSINEAQVIFVTNVWQFW